MEGDCADDTTLHETICGKSDCVEAITDEDGICEQYEIEEAIVWLHSDCDLTNGTKPKL